MNSCVIQRQKTELYILFPEYQDASHCASVPYVKNIEVPLNDSIPNCIDDILSIISFFDYEYTDRYYDGRNLEGALYPYEILEYPNVRSYVYADLVRLGVVDWHDDIDGGVDILYYQGNPCTDDICSVASQRGVIDREDLKVHSVLLATRSTLDKEMLLSSLKDSHGQCIRLSIVENARQLYTWFSENRIPQRRFDYNEKHGENKIEKTVRPDGGITCPLRCHRVHAQEFLCKAIGKDGRNGDLWFWDEVEKMHIYFENQKEVPQPAFHGYHVEQGDVGYDKIDKEAIKKFL